VPRFCSASIPAMGEKFANRKHTEVTDKPATIRMAAGVEQAPGERILRKFRNFIGGAHGAVA